MPCYTGTMPTKVRMRYATRCNADGKDAANANGGGYNVAVHDVLFCVAICDAVLCCYRCGAVIKCVMSNATIIHVWVDRRFVAYNFSPGGGTPNLGRPGSM